MQHGCVEKTFMLLLWSFIKSPAFQPSTTRDLTLEMIASGSNPVSISRTAISSKQTPCTVQCNPKVLKDSQKRAKEILLK